MTNNELKSFIISEAKKLGFDKIGFVPVGEVSRQKEFNQWLNNNYHGSMSWMENYKEQRLDPSKLMENARTMICFATNHYKDAPYDNDKPYIAKYALADDYHGILKKRLKTLSRILAEKIEHIQCRYFTDTAPILERYWAEKAGLGWQGKNSLLITRDFGSYVFLSEMIINIDIESDQPHQNYCGTCSNCLETCPTEAIVEPYVVDSKKCISYLTIEHRNNFTEENSKRTKNHLFGCDICQDVCPWNKFAKISKDMHFTARHELLDKSMEFWRFLSEEQFEEIFQKSAIKRTKYSGFKRNIEAVIKNLGKTE